ncbi:MAG TPA: retron system putative HNH endonuclease, partial [Allocoleopsis sp.]
MKYIRKNIEPPDFMNWKNQQKSLGVNFNYKSFQHPQKKIVKESLLREQGYICCYCCRKINQKNSHIEHFLPQSKTDDNLALDYHNMLISCG